MPWFFQNATWENLEIHFIYTFMEPKHIEMTETSLKFRKVKV